MVLQPLQANNNPDTWKYIWGAKECSSQKAYKHLTGSHVVHPSFKWIWASSCQLKDKVFYWLLLKNRLNTRGLLRKEEYAS
jgi:hypothetical protein